MTRYINRKLIAKGGMGSIYKAWDSLLDRWVAIKDCAEHHEAVTHASLNHPNICSIFDRGTDESGHWVVMQFIDGKNSDDLEGMTPRRVASIIRDAARGVQFAHDNGIIHRDLKPENLLVTASGHCYVMDFGLSRTPVTAIPGEVAGTPPYMSPQQMKGLPADVRDDVFSLGATLSHLLPKAPSTLTAIVRKATAHDPNQRFSSAAQLADALDAFLLRRRRKIMLSLASVVMFGVLGVLGASYVAHSQRETARVALNLCRRGEVLLNSENDVLGAIAAFGESIKIKPDPRTYHFRGFCYYRLGAYDEAVKDAESALAFDPSNEIAIYNYRRAKDGRDRAAAEAEDSATSPRRR